MFKFLKIKINSPEKIAFVLAFFTICSYVLAILRDKILASKFSAGEVLDVYIASFKIPDLIFLSFSGIFAGVILIPLLNENEKRGEEFLQDFINKLFTTFFVLIFFVCILFFIFMPILADFLFPNFSQKSLEDLILFSRLILLSPIFMGIEKIFSSINQTKKNFIPAALTGFSYNLFIMFGILFLYPFFGFIGVIYGVVFGAFFTILLQIPNIILLKKIPKKISFFKAKDFFYILKKALPRSFYLLFLELIFFLLIVNAALLKSGSVVSINFALNIYTFPILLIALSFLHAYFPKISENFTNSDRQNFTKNCQEAFSKIFFFLIPIYIFIIFFSKEIIGLLYGSQRFGFENIKLVALLSSFLAVAGFFAVIFNCHHTFLYAIKRPKTPIFSIFFLLTCFYFLLNFFQNIDFLKMEKMMVFLDKFLQKFFDLQNSEQILGLLILVFSYLLACFFTIFFSTYIFKKSMKNFVSFSLIKEAKIFKKIFLSFFSVFCAKILVINFGLPEENNFFVFLLNILFAIFLCIIFWVILSEIFPDEQYKKYRKKFINFFKNKFLKIWK